MRAAFSFWSLPFRGALAGRARFADWADQRHGLLAWALAARRARRFVGPTELITDSYGAKLFADLGIAFDDVRVELDVLEREDPRIWVQGKLLAYISAAKRGPFLHLDNDVWLTRRLPRAVLDAQLVAQSIEPINHPNYAGTYAPTIEALRRWPMPPSWLHDLHSPVQHAFNMGLVGGQRVDVLDRAAREGFNVLANANWERAGLHPNNVSCVAEQYTFGATARAMGVPVATLLRGPANEPAADVDAQRLGYSHAMGMAKRDPVVISRLLARAQAECPEATARIFALFPAPL